MGYRKLLPGVVAYDRRRTSGENPTALCDSTSFESSNSYAVLSGDSQVIGKDAQRNNLSRRKEGPIYKARMRLTPYLTLCGMKDQRDK